jgi:hypothetical protein
MHVERVLNQNNVRAPFRAWPMRKTRPIEFSDLTA